MSSSDDDGIISGFPKKGNKKKRKRSNADKKPKKKQRTATCTKMAYIAKESPAEVKLNETELLEAINSNPDDFHFILSLSGKLIHEGSTKKMMKSAYRKLSKLVHPDRHKGSKNSTNAFQFLVQAFEQLSNPTPEECAPADRKKNKRSTRSNEGCSITKIACPRCHSQWERDNLGLEKPSYNFFMSGIKQYLCGRCLMKFGSLTASHKTPCCSKPFLYNPNDYDAKLECSEVQTPPDAKLNKKQTKCNKTFGFWRFKVSERREIEIRREVKKEQDQDRKKRAATKRRQARLNRRSPAQQASTKTQETLFVIGLKAECPRCGFESEETSMSRHAEIAKKHLKDCNDVVKIKAYQEKLKQEKLEKEKKAAEEKEEAEVLLVKTWELNGRQVGQLWMLPENQLRNQCKLHKLKSKGPTPELIKRLVKYLKSQQTLMITDGREYEEDGKNAASKYDMCGVQHVDEDDLPDNLHSLEVEELQGLCAGFGIKYAKKRCKGRFN